MSRYLTFLAVAVIAMVSFLGFQGKKSKDTPVYVFDDMDYQSKYKAQGENKFFKDGRDARPPVEGTVVRGNALEPAKVFAADFRRAESLNPSFVTGKDAKGAFLVGFPAKSLTVLAGGELERLMSTPRHSSWDKPSSRFTVRCATGLPVMGTVS
jgi:hypothetical protein